MLRHKSSDRFLFFQIRPNFRPKIKMAFLCEKKTFSSKCGTYPQKVMAQNIFFKWAKFTRVAGPLIAHNIQSFLAFLNHYKH